MTTENNYIETWKSIKLCELTFDSVPKVILVLVNSIDECHYVADGIAFCNVYFLIWILDFRHVFRVLRNFEYFNDHLFRYGTHIWRPVVSCSYLKIIVNLILNDSSSLHFFFFFSMFVAKNDDHLISANEMLQKINNKYLCGVAKDTRR